MERGDIERIVGSAPDRKAAAVALAEALPAGRMIEIGVWKGAFAASLLSACPGIREYWMLDPWQTLDDWNKPFNRADFDAVYEEAMAATEFAADRRRVLRGRTTERIGEVPEGSLDMAYIDGDHTLRGIIVDLVALWPRMRPGALILGDDFVPSIWQHDPRFEPTLVYPAAVHFAEGAGAPIYALPHGQFLIVKPEAGERAHDFVDLTGFYRHPDLLTQIRRQPFRGVWETVLYKSRLALRGGLGRRRRR